MTTKTINLMKTTAIKALRRLLDGDLDHLSELANRIQREKGCNRQAAETVAAMVHADLCLNGLDDEGKAEAAPVLARWVSSVNAAAA